MTSTCWPPPPTVRVGVKLPMVSAVHRDKLAECAARHRIPVAARHDLVWGDILEPFLDTEFTDADQQRTMSRLEAAGIGPGQVAGLRDRFGPAMWLYNLAIPRWEWGHLGLGKPCGLPWHHHPGTASPAHRTAALPSAETASG